MKKILYTILVLLYMGIVTGVIGLGEQKRSLRQENAALKQTIAAQKEDMDKARTFLEATLEKIKQNQKAGLPITDGWPTSLDNTNKPTGKE